MARRRSRSSSSNTQSAYRRYRREEERRFEILTFGALIILMLILAFSNNNSNGRFISYAGGGVLLGSAIIQWQRKFQINPFTWLGAAALLALGYFWPAGQLVPTLYPLLIMAAVMAISFFTGEI